MYVVFVQFFLFSYSAFIRSTGGCIFGAYTHTRKHTYKPEIVRETSGGRKGDLSSHDSQIKRSNIESIKLNRFYLSYEYFGDRVSPSCTFSLSFAVLSWLRLPCSFLVYFFYSFFPVSLLIVQILLHQYT